MNQLGDQDRTDQYEVLSFLLQLRKEIISDAKQILERWKPLIEREEFLPSALNLAQYIVLRKRDLRSLQRQLQPIGLSSLGRTEAHVLPNLDAIISSLGAICGIDVAALPARPSVEMFEAGGQRLERNVESIFGKQRGSRAIRIMVTLPTEAATNPKLIHDMLDHGVDCFRINCSHDDMTLWDKMIRNVREAQRDLGYHASILMDLPGLKLRTTEVLTPTDTKKIERDAIVLLSASKLHYNHRYPFQIRCPYPQIFERIETGQQIWMDDGRVGMTVIKKVDEGLVLKVMQVRAKGESLKVDKGINIPAIDLGLPPLDDDDLTDLEFIASHADIVGYSYVQRPEDIVALQTELERLLGDDAKRIAIVAKIETPLAVRNLPEMIVRAAGKQPFAVMIARGDLAIEIGYERLAEIQEEILWVCEAAHVPVIWATQVLENLVKKGVPSRAEITDAAMGERAECVMLNKGPFILEGVKTLDRVLKRMEGHHRKKSSQLRALKMWKDLV